jgi:predicted deacetylase
VRMSGRRRQRTIAVALHDVEPATFDRCALIRDWLGDHGVGRATLLVIPAPDLHPFSDRRPELARWLEDRAHAGDAIAQHGLHHAQIRRGSPLRQAVARVQGGAATEFVGLDDQETHDAVQAGRRVMRLAGLEPRGFVAPAYAYTPALRRELAGAFDWWAGLLGMHRRAGDARSWAAAPALTLGTSSVLKRALSPLAVRAGAAIAGRTLRLDLHPADFEHPRHVLALESVLRRAGHRTALTYDDLLAH